MTPDLRLVGPDDVEALQELLESIPAFAERLTGYPPGPSDALSAVLSVPPDLDPSDKRCLGLWIGTELVAFADVLLGYPSPDCAYLGMLAVHADHQRIGWGRRLHDEVVRCVVRESEASRIRLGIVATNADVAEPFVGALGYASTDDAERYRYDKLTSTITHWEKSVR